MQGCWPPLHGVCEERRLRCRKAWMPLLHHPYSCVLADAGWVSSGPPPELLHVASFPRGLLSTWSLFGVVWTSSLCGGCVPGRQSERGRRKCTQSCSPVLSLLMEESQRFAHALGSDHLPRPIISPDHAPSLFPSPGALPNPGIDPRFPTLQADSLPAEPSGKLLY